MLKIVVLAGGVGGSKFVLGLRRAVAGTDAAITVVCNTGDDMWLAGLRVCPDLDSMMYALAGVNDRRRGWGRADETTRVSAELSAFGLGTEWFTLGDQWWVRHRATLPALEFASTDVADVRPAPGVAGALQDADIVLVAPSNPVVSIGTILAIPGMREAVRRRAAASSASRPSSAGPWCAAWPMPACGRSGSPSRPEPWRGITGRGPRAGCSTAGWSVPRTGQRPNRCGRTASGQQPCPCG